MEEAKNLIKDLYKEFKREDILKIFGSCLKTPYIITKVCKDDVLSTRALDAINQYLKN